MQRCLSGSVHVAGELVGEIGQGLVVLVGIHRDDNEKDLETMVKKMCSANLFSREEDEGRWSESVLTMGFKVLLVSQFTLYATFKGKKPIFSKSMSPEPARELFDKFVELTKEALGADKVETGRFGTLMEVGIKNHGPVTIVIDSKKQELD